MYPHYLNRKACFQSIFTFGSVSDKKNLIVIGTAGVEQDPYPEKIMYSNNMHGFEDSLSFIIQYSCQEDESSRSSLAVKKLLKLKNPMMWLAIKM